MERVIGQDRAIGVLQKQLGSGRLHHAYIFHGPPGVGKFTTAIALSRVLLCHQRVTDLTGQVAACGGCESCRLIDAKPNDADDANADELTALSASHPDLHVVTKELARYDDDRTVRERKLRSIPVEVLRKALIEPAHRSPQLAGGKFGKVFVVDEAELLNPAGQNALLKTLEEPTPGTTIILVTASEDRLLPTIRSRCQRVAFVPLSDEVVGRWIERHEPDIPPQRARWLAGFAGGSLGRVRLATEYGLGDWAEQILPAIDRMAAGKAVGDLGPQLAERVNQFAEAWVKAHPGASKDAANQLAAALCMNIIATDARRRLAEAATRCDPADPVSGDALTGPWLAVIDALSDTERHLASNVNLAMAFDHLALSINEALTGVAG